MSALVAVVVVTAILALAVYRNAVSKRSQSVVLALTPAEAAGEVKAAFARVAWVNTVGPGYINKGRVAKSSRMLVISIDIIDCGNDTSEVRMWVSARKDLIAGFTIANGTLKASQLAARLRRHPACIAEPR